MSYFGSIYADQDLSHRARTVYMYLKDRSDAGNTCWPSVRRIAEDLKLSRRTVQRALTDLERHGFLERTHRRRPIGSLPVHFRMYLGGEESQRNECAQQLAGGRTICSLR